MHGKGEGEESRRQFRNLHTQKVPKYVGSAYGAGGSLSFPASPSPSFFCKDGRKVSAGECALFKPAEGSPPFIGIVCSLSADKEKNLTLGVNWLYRPTEVKLGKGILLEVAPNEVFYSFRRNAIPASSLLHPCKVAFLSKGVELPLGISAFVCRRVYDIGTSCLWWLTDKNYLNEQQEEINRLLQKTQIEMQASAQPNRRSPKQTNGPMSTTKSKPGTDSVHNTVSQGRGKKRDRGDQSSDAVKRERYEKLEHSDSDLVKSESSLKSEIAKVSEKGLLVDSEGVERLVQVMFCEKKNFKKADLSARSMLTSVIAGTDKLDCLHRFVELRGLSVLDDWLQEIHKGKNGDGNGLKDNEKQVEEFLLLVLRALEKLPVNLQALQLCNIGKSVNHLRSHKSLEIQTKARNLVITWKKRVEAEMNISDTGPSSTQTVSWSGKSRAPEVPHGNRQAGGSSAFGPKSPIVQLTSNKTAPAKLMHGEPDLVVGSPGSTKLAASHVNFKDGQLRATITSHTSDLPSTMSRDEKSSSSSPSHNNSQSYSSDLVKAGGVSVKEDARSSTAGSSKLSSGTSRSKKSKNGFPGSAGHDNGPSRTSSLQKNVTLDKACQSGLTVEKAVDVSSEGNGNGHNLIVKIPNRGGSPPPAATEVCPDEVSVIDTRSSSPALAKRPDQSDAVMEEKVDTSQASVNSDANSDSWQSNDFRDLLTACDDDGDSSDAVGDKDKHLESEENTTKMPDALRTTGKFSEASLSPMNALIQSCVNFSSTNNPPLSVGDAVGMNLLASVAAGEMFKSELKCDESPKRNLASAEQDCAGNGSEMKSSPHALEKSLLKESTNGLVPSSEKVDCSISTLYPETLPEEKRGFNSSSMDPESAAEPCSGSNDAGNGMTVDASAAVSPATDVVKNEIYGGKELKEQNGLHSNPGAKEKPDYLLSVENKAANDISSTKKKEGTSKVVSALGAVEQKHTERILAENIEKEVKNIDKLNMEKLSERDVVSNDKHNELKSDKLPALNIETSESKLPGTGSKADETEQCSSSTTLPPATRAPSTPLKLEFDLNEGLETEDTKFGEPMSYTVPNSASVPLISPLRPAASLHNAGLPAPIAVAASAKGPFIPPNDLLKAKVELGGWKGSAATSAFRPAEPRKIFEKSIGMLDPTNASSVKKNRPPLDFDLNVPGERIIEVDPEHSVLQIASLYSHCRSSSQREMIGSICHTDSIGLGLDLNQIGEAADVGNFVLGNGRRLDVSLLAMKPSGNLPNDVGVGGRRDFDLNDDALGAEPSTSSQHVKTSVLPQHTLQGLRMNVPDMANFSAWFQPGSTYPDASTPSILSERGEQQPYPFNSSGGHPRMLGPSSGAIAFNSDMYRGSVLSSSPAVPFPTSPFQYSVFPYGTSFPLPSASLSGSATTYVDSSTGGRVCFPRVHSQLLGPSTAVTAPFSRPYVVSAMASPFSDGSSNSGVDSSKKWTGRGGLDLNTGPGGGDVEGRDETSPLLSRQLQPQAEEQARMYQVSSGVMKRKEPDGGWDSYRQPSWQQ